MKMRRRWSCGSGIYLCKVSLNISLLKKMSVLHVPDTFPIHGTSQLRPCLGDDWAADLSTAEGYTSTYSILFALTDLTHFSFLCCYQSRLS